MMDPILVTIKVYSHSLVVTYTKAEIRNCLLMFCRNLVTIGFKKVGYKWVRGIDKVFAGSTKDRSEFSFHRNQLESLIQFLSNSGIDRNFINVTVQPLYRPLSIKLDYIDERLPKDYQAPIIDYILEKGNTKVVTLQPGRGKTFIALSVMRELSTRTFFCIKPRYIEKWIDDLNEAFNLEKEDIVVIKGSINLKKLMNQYEDLTAKVIICSNATYHQYLKTYELWGKQIKQSGFAFAPIEFCKRLKIGFRVIDEVHQDLYNNYRQFLYSHVPKTLSLSGTLESDERTINRIYQTLFPTDIRYKELAPDVYIEANALFYSIPNAEHRIRFINHALNSYSHIRFEQSILKQKSLLIAYIKMIYSIVETYYLNKAVKGQKMIIYCSTIEMCNLVLDYLTKKVKRFEVSRYVGEDNYEEMLKSELIVSTIKSLGTAIDILNLRVILMTDALASRQANLQASGRLRRMKDYPEVTPQFLYLVCRDIKKHKEYHRHKKILFTSRVLSHNEIQLDHRL